MALSVMTYRGASQIRYNDNHYHLKAFSFMPMLNKQNDMGSLYEANYSWFTSWLRARVGCSHEAADVLQDTFLRLLCSSSQNKDSPIQNPRPFLVTVAKRVIVDKFRRRQLEIAFNEMMLHRAEFHEVSAEERHMMLEVLLQLEAVLDGLGERAKSAFLMSQVEGLKYAEIAKRLGVTVSSVTKYVAKGTEAYLLFILDSEL